MRSFIVRSAIRTRCLLRCRFGVHWSWPQLSEDGGVGLVKGASWGESKGRQELLSCAVTQIKEQKKKRRVVITANSSRAMLVLFRIKKQLLSKNCLTLQALSYSVTLGACRSLSWYIPYWNIWSTCCFLEGISIKNLGIEPCFFKSYSMLPLMTSSRICIMLCIK